jgi:acyl-CoA synthetase (AMP-forming)/AMP-acid ligase II
MSEDTVSLLDIAKNFVKATPNAPQATMATLKALTLKKEKQDSIGALLEKQAKDNPHNIALRYLDQSYSYAEFNAASNRYAHYLAQIGIRSGDAVAVFMENRPEVLMAVAGIVKLGAIASMINTSQRGDVLKHSLTLVSAKRVIVGEELAEPLLEVASELGDHFARQCLFVREYDGASLPQGMVDLDHELAHQPVHNPSTTSRVLLGQPAYYIFTSGTTGLPKASVMSHIRWMRAQYGLGQAAMFMQPEDVMYCSLPLYHNNALTLCWGSAMGAGATLALARKFSASRFWDDIRQYNATAFCYIGELCRYLLAQPAKANDQDHQVRVCMGNGLRPEIWDEFKTRFGIQRINEFYGASESNIAFTNAFNVDRTAGFCPLSFAVVEYDIDADEPVKNAKGFLNKVKAGGTGLLISEVTEKMSFDGYTDKSASDSKLMRDVFKKGDCYFNTGDLVRNQGYKHIAFVDRLGDTFRWKGENVATTEVEGAVGDWAQVETGCVYGVEVPGADGRAGMAAITPNCDLKDFDFSGFIQHLNNALPSYAVPQYLRFREAQEVTGTFKFRKVELKKQGFDPVACAEPVFALEQGQYVEIRA